MTTQTTTLAPVTPLLTGAELAPMLRFGSPITMPLTDSMPVVLQLLSKLLDSLYRVETKTCAVSEKNKGGDYHSTNFYLDTVFEELTPGTTADPQVITTLQTALSTHAFTLHGLSAAAMESVYGMCPIAFANIAPPDPAQPAVEDDYHQLVELTAGAPLLVRYAPLRAQLNAPALALNPWHKTLYQACVTKWYEHSANPQPVHASVIAHERAALQSRYELFLCNVLTQYFNLTPVST